MIEAANAALLDPAEGERNASVHAIFVKNANFSFGISKNDEVLAEQASAKRLAIRLW
jgi:hypothetical protein